jgi:hypothetical protein
MGSDVHLQKRLCACLEVLLGSGCPVFRRMEIMDLLILILLAFLLGARLAEVYLAVAIVMVVPVPRHGAILVRNRSSHSRTLGVSHHP